jgi:hypothetical protein
LRELLRVLKSEGIGYLAVPNRWQVKEPHYRLAFLSWLPPRWRTPYLRYRKRGIEYDCRPPTVSELECLLRSAGFHFEQQHGRALLLTFGIERPQSIFFRAFLQWVPESVFAATRRAFPTLIYVLYPIRPS